MPYPSQDIVISNGATLTATPSSVYVVPPSQFTAFIGYVQVGTVSGTSPTLDVQIYQGVRLPQTTDTAGKLTTTGAGAFDTNNYVWVPYGQLKQITATNQKTIFGVVGGGQYNATVGTSLLFPTAGTFQNGPIGSLWKVDLTIGGTNPSFGTVKAMVQFIP